MQKYKTGEKFKFTERKSNKRNVTPLSPLLLLSEKKPRPPGREEITLCEQSWLLVYLVMLIRHSHFFRIPPFPPPPDMATMVDDLKKLSLPEIPLKEITSRLKKNKDNRNLRPKTTTRCPNILLNTHTVTRTNKHSTC